MRVASVTRVARVMKGSEGDEHDVLQFGRASRSPQMAQFMEGT